jgi:predicted nucleotidyltransferase
MGGESEGIQQESIPRQVGEIVRSLEPEAEIRLYGSHARGDSRSDSDWDFLILLKGPLDEARKDALRFRLYALEVESGQLISSFIVHRKDWDSALFQAMPFRQNVVREGVPL